MYIVSEVVQVRVNGAWYDAEVLDVTSTGIYCYIFDLRIKKNIANANIR